MTNIDLILPSYNPKDGWEKNVVINLSHLLSICPTINFNVIIVDDGAQKGYNDGEELYIQSKIPNVTFVKYKKNRGKGFAIREALKYSFSDYIIYTDYDFPYTHESFKMVCDQLVDNGLDIVVASRHKSYQQRLPLLRKVLSSASHVCNRCLLRLSVIDTQGGLKGFNKRGREVFLTTKINGFLFDTEFVYRSCKRGLNVGQIDAAVRGNIEISNFGFNTIRREIINFIFIALNV